MNLRATIALAAGVITLAVAVLFAGAALAPRPATYHGTHIAPPMPASDFTLDSADGPVSLSDLRGDVAVLFFGYTSCPDVCPLTLLRVNRALEQLGEARDRVRVVFISVDPERDTPEKATEYARAVHPSFLGLSGSPERIDEVAGAFGIYHAKAEGSHETGHLVDHTATITVLNPDGAIELYWSSTVTAPQMAEDLATLLRS